MHVRKGGAVDLRPVDSNPASPPSLRRPQDPDLQRRGRWIRGSSHHHQSLGSTASQGVVGGGGGEWEGRGSWICRGATMRREASSERESEVATVRGREGKGRVWRRRGFGGEGVVDLQRRVAA